MSSTKAAEYPPNCGRAFLTLAILIMPVRLRNHLLFWIAYVGLKAYLNYSGEDPISWTTVGLLFFTQLSFLVIKIPLVYGSFYITDKYLESQWPLHWVIATLGVAFAVASYAMWATNLNFVLPVLWKIEVSKTGFSIESLVYYFFTLMFVVGLAFAIRLFRRQYELKLHEARLQKEKTEAELKYLKGQINPHFLFNTLNNIYSLARKGSAHTAESVMKLAALMRFMLYETSSPEIPLKAELKVIGDYIELEKLRYSDRLHTEFVTDIDNPDQPIAPLLLIHFVENAFKHGAGESRADVDVRISVTLKHSLLTAEISNPIGLERVSTETTRIGMENTKRQLDLLYPGHTLVVNTKGNRFVVLLTIPLKFPR